jgi:hypothetical protein
VDSLQFCNLIKIICCLTYTPLPSDKTRTHLSASDSNDCWALDCLLPEVIEANVLSRLDYSGYSPSWTLVFSFYFLLLFFYFLEGLGLWWLTDLSQVTDKLFSIMLYRVQLTWAGFELTTLVVIGIDYTGSCKSNYHTITTTTVPFLFPVTEHTGNI